MRSRLLRFFVLFVVSFSVPVSAFAAFSFPKFILRAPASLGASLSDMVAGAVGADGSGGVTVAGAVSAITDLGTVALASPYVASAAVVAAAAGAWYSADPKGFTGYMQSVGAVLSGLTPSSSGYGVAAAPFSDTATCASGAAVLFDGRYSSISAWFAAANGISFLSSTGAPISASWSPSVLLVVVDNQGSPSGFSFSVSCADGSSPSAGVNPTPVAATPATSAQVQSGVAGWLAANPSMAPGLASAEAAAGHPPALSPGGLASGPSSITGPSTTTTATATNGDITKTVCAPSYSVTYSDAAASISGGQNCTSTTLSPTGQTVGTSSTSTVSQPASAPVSQASAPAAPSTSASASVGSFVAPITSMQPASAPVGVITLPSAVVSGAGGTCPAPWTYSAFGVSFSIPLTGLCDLAGEIRPFFLGLNGLGAALFILR